MVNKNIILVILLGISFNSYSSTYLATSYVDSSYSYKWDGRESKDSHRNGWGLGLGYKFDSILNTNVAVELGYSDFLSDKIEGEKIHSDAWLASGTLHLPITILDIYGRAGIGSFDSNLGKNTSIYGGIGTGLSLGPFRVALEYTKYDTKVVDDSVSLRGEIHF